MLRSSFNQWFAFGAPRISSKKKFRLGAWTFKRGIYEGRDSGKEPASASNGATCIVLNDSFLAMGMRVPKAASSTLQDLVEALAGSNGFAMSRVVQRHSVRHANRTYEEKRLVEYLSGLQRRTVHTAHVPFLDFAALGFPRPVYFATLRDPFRRLSSHYDYEHFGPRPLYMRLVHQDTRAETFGECIQRHMNGGGGGAAGGGKSLKRNFDCLQTAGLQVRFFCGVSEWCRRTSAGTLAAATRNLERNFASVVIVERMLASFKVLEAVLPHLFHGLVAKYLASSSSSSSSASSLSSGAVVRGSLDNTTWSAGASKPFPKHEEEEGLHARANEAPKASNGQVSAEQRAFVMADTKLQLEYDLYSFASRRLSYQAEACALPRRNDGTWRRRRRVLASSS